MRIVVYPHLMTVGGSQLNAIELAAAVRDRGHEVTVFAAEPGPLGETVERFGLPLVLAPRHRKRPSIPIARALRDLCRREQIDIVHGYEWPPCLEAFYGPLLCDGVSVGCTVMSMSVAPFLPSSVPLIVGSEQIAAAARLARSGPVRVIEPPVDTEANHPGIDGTAFRTRYGLGDRPTIVLVSRLAVALKLEGIERAMRAMALLAPDTGAQLVVVGDGPAREHLARVAGEVNASTGGATVTMTGELTDPRPAYAAADVLLGMGGSALRAMAFAKPVVVLGELGFARVFSPGTVDLFLWQGFYGLGDGDQRADPFADLLRPLVVDPARRTELGEFAREFVESRCSLVAAGEYQEELYREWLAIQPSRTVLVAEGAGTAAQVLVGKVRQRLDRWRGREASEDFNTVTEIAKTAALAERSH
jgi:glycosyltransferase involved in cell wall biosynthesis